MTDATINPKHKDRLFVKLFGGQEMKPNIISLYNALNGSDYPEDSDVEITTLEDVIFMGMKNDVSFMIDSRLTLWEQQSSWNPNMPIRGLMYFGKVYEAYFDKIGKERLFFSSLVKIPSPRYVVFYNGEDRKNLAPITKLRLSDAFQFPADNTDFEWTATVYNLNGNNNSDLLKKCKPLSDYMAFINAIRRFKKGHTTEEAVNLAVDWCIENDVLKELLSKYRAEVKDMCLTEFDAKAYEDLVRKESLKEGQKKGMDKLSKLIILLNDAGRSEDIIVAATDSHRLQELLAEYGLNDEE